MLCQISVEDSDLDQVLVISTHDPAKIDYNAILSTIPTLTPPQNGSSSLPSFQSTFEDRPNPFLRKTTPPTKLFIFNEANSKENMSTINLAPSTESTQTISNFESTLTVGNGGPFLIVDPNLDFESFNEDANIKLSTESNERNQPILESHEIVKTTEPSFDYLLSRDVFIPQQVEPTNPILLSSNKKEIATMEYDISSYDSYPDYAFNEMDFDDMNIQNKINEFEYQDELDMPTLDTTLLSIEQNPPEKFRPQDSPKPSPIKHIPDNTKKESVMNGRLLSTFFMIIYQFIFTQTSFISRTNYSIVSTNLFNVQNLFFVHRI